MDSRGLRRCCVAVLLAAGCGDQAQAELSEAAQSLNQAGNNLHDAAIQSAEELDDRVEVARDDLESAKAIADKAGDAYLDSGDEVVSGHAVRCADEAYEVDRELVRRAVNNPLALAGRSSFVVRPDGGGVQIDAVDPQSPVSGLDLRPGDVIVAVDGVAIDQLDGPALLERLDTATGLTATVERGGVRVTKTVRITDG